MVKVAYLFPGQGSQAVGMGQASAAASAHARRVLDRADNVLGFAISKFMFEGPEDRLKDTAITQPALFVASAMALEVLKDQGVKPMWAAGHSLGEYSALYAAGALDFDTTIRLVQERGRLMSDAGRERPGAMAAIIGLDGAAVETACREASDAGVCAPANFNTESQIVISGEPAAVAKAMERATAAGAAKVIPLNVSGAFHSPLMSDAAQRMKAFLDTARFSDASIPVVTNIDARPTTLAADFKKKLFEQIDHPVRWHDSMRTLAELGAEGFVEVGSGRVLSTMAKKFDRKKVSVSTDDTESIEKILLAPSAGA